MPLPEFYRITVPDMKCWERIIGKWTLPIPKALDGNLTLSGRKWSFMQAPSQIRAPAPKIQVSLGCQLP